MLDVKNNFSVLCVSLVALQPLINLKFYTWIIIVASSAYHTPGGQTFRHGSFCFLPIGELNFELNNYECYNHAVYDTSLLWKALTTFNRIDHVYFQILRYSSRETSQQSVVNLGVGAENAFALRNANNYKLIIHSFD